VVQISVILPTYRRPVLLRRAIASVLSQDFTDIEVIVVNDDPDLAPDVPSRDPRVRVLQNARSKGACGARNTGIFAASGRWVTGLDDDDQFQPGRLSSLMQAYGPGTSFVSSNIAIDDGRTVSTYFGCARTIGFQDLLWGNCVGSQVLTERSKLLDVGGFDEGLESGQDWDLWLRLTKRWGVGRRIAEALYLQHVEHGGVRISTGPRRLQGLHDLYLKFEPEMNASQRLWNRIQLRRFAGKAWIGLFLVSIADMRCANHYKNMLLKRW